MIDLFEFGSEFFEGLKAIDVAIVEQAAQQPCAECGGRLYRGDYPRKPRGGRIAVEAEGWLRRFSLCCGKEGCRRRATPPSVRFLGRRVYVGAVVVVASAFAIATAAASAAIRATGIPARSIRRWLRWWRDSFPASKPFAQLSARLVPTPERRRLPLSLLQRFSPKGEGAVSKLLTWLAPLTTASCPDAATLLRAGM